MIFHFLVILFVLRTMCPYLLTLDHTRFKVGFVPQQDLLFAEIKEKTLETSMMKSGLMRCALLTVSAWTMAGSAVAQSDFPSKPVRIVVPYSAGGTADLLPRVIGEKLTAIWKQPVVIENRTGAGGNIGADYVAKAAPDGYTLLVTPPAPLVINQYLYRNLPFDPEKLEPVTVLAQVPNVLAVRHSFPANNAAEFINYARQNVGKVTVANQGNGTTSHLTGALVAAQAGLSIVPVPYKGTAPALADLMGGQVDAFFDNITSTYPQAKAGKVRVLAVTSKSRSPLMPDMPTLDESGLSGFDVSTWFGVAAPAGTPPEIVATVAEAIRGVLQMPDVQARFAEQGAEVVANTPDEMRSFMQSERQKWKSAIDSADVSIN